MEESRRCLNLLPVLIYRSPNSSPPPFILTTNEANSHRILTSSSTSFSLSLIDTSSTLLSLTLFSFHLCVTRPQRRMLFAFARVKIEVGCKRKRVQEREKRRVKKIFVVNNRDGRGRAYAICETLAFRFIRFLRDRVIPAIFSRTLQHPPSSFPSPPSLSPSRYLENFFHDSSTIDRSNRIIFQTSVF